MCSHCWLKLKIKFFFHDEHYIHQEILWKQNILQLNSALKIQKWGCSDVSRRTRASHTCCVPFISGKCLVHHFIKVVITYVTPKQLEIRVNNFITVYFSNHSCIGEMHRLVQLLKLMCKQILIQEFYLDDFQKSFRSFFVCYNSLLVRVWNYSLNRNENDK